MSYTNVTIPNYYGTRESQARRIRQLENELKEMGEARMWLEKILYNIPEAVKQYGYVDISDESGRIITLIEKSEVKDAE